VFLNLVNPSESKLRLEGEGVYLREATKGDYQAWAELRAASETWLVPWEPEWRFDELSRACYLWRLQGCCRGRTLWRPGLRRVPRNRSPSRAAGGGGATRVSATGTGSGASGVRSARVYGRKEGCRAALRRALKRKWDAAAPGQCGALRADARQARPGRDKTRKRAAACAAQPNCSEAGKRTGIAAARADVRRARASRRPVAAKRRPDSGGDRGGQPNVAEGLKR
jgi:hypothetical protein